MATTNTPLDFSPNSFRRLDPTKYTSLGDFINEVNKPDNRDLLVKTYGNQGITGFLQMVGAVKSNGAADEVQYWEETRLHQLQTVNFPAAGVAAGTAGTSIVLTMASATATATGATKAAAQKYLRVNDVILVGGVDRFIITAVSAGEYSQTATAAATAVALSSAGLTTAIASAAAPGVQANLPIVGNMFAQGTDQNVGYLESNVVKRTNPYQIIKEVYKVTGSQATNIGWVNLGNGDYRWFIKSENDTRQRFLDKREMMMLLGEQVSNSAGISSLGSIAGSEGYFSAIADRGVVVNSGSVSTAAIATLDELDVLITALDKQGSMPEYAMYVNRLQDLAIDDMIAQGTSTAANITAGVATQFGQFANAADMVKLGFSSFMRGSYTFHKHSWKLLNDPTLLGASNFQGVMIPLTNVADPRTGEKSPALELNYKATNGYNREMEHWMTGSILGVTNANTDALQFNYRSEFALVTRAANQHVLLTK
jgi:hypothetical protein